MSMHGENLPAFRQVQIDFSAHIRNPEANPRPADVDARRMQVYVDLFYKNIERLIGGTFRVAHEVLGEDDWHRLVRDFVHRHVSTTPYFLEIPQEFMAFVAARDNAAPAVPEYFLELCHYEWVELALDVSQDEIDREDVDPEGDILAGVPCWSPVAMNLCYRYPVHEIGPAHRPLALPAEPTYLIVYRDRADKVRFMGSNVVTARLASLIQAEEGATGEALLTRIADELASPDRDAVLRHGRDTLQRLRSADIIAGAFRV